ncbi:MAG: hypothetical protein U1E52_02070 [Geminicoccaceae bacterium]
MTLSRARLLPGGLAVRLAREGPLAAGFQLLQPALTTPGLPSRSTNTVSPSRSSPSIRSMQSRLVIANVALPSVCQI